MAYREFEGLVDSTGQIVLNRQVRRGDYKIHLRMGFKGACGEVYEVTGYTTGGAPIFTHFVHVDLFPSVTLEDFLADFDELIG